LWHFKFNWTILFVVRNYAVVRIKSYDIIRMTPDCILQARLMPKKNGIVKYLRKPTKQKVSLHPSLINIILFWPAPIDIFGNGRLYFHNLLFPHALFMKSNNMDSSKGGGTKFFRPTGYIYIRVYFWESASLRTNEHTFGGVEIWVKNTCRMSTVVWMNTILL
jgi:hypothetical protein